MFYILKQLKAVFFSSIISYAVDANQYPAAPESTVVPARANTTQATSIASYEEYDNSELEVISIARGRTPFLHTLINLGRGLSWGDYKTMGVNEMISQNFPEFKWRERDEFKDTFVVSTQSLLASTLLKVASTVGLYKGLLLRNTTTNEQFRITAIVNATDLTVQRGVGTVAAADMEVDDEVIVLSSAATKWESGLDSFFVANQDRSNYFQKFLTTASVDDFDVLSNKINGWEDIVTEKTIQHSLEMEKAVLFGQKKSSADPVTWKAFYTMEGVLENAKRGWTNDISAALTNLTLEEALQSPLKYTKDGSYKKIVLCGSKVRSTISALFETRLRVTQIKDVDLTFESLKINQWEFIFVEHPMLDESSGYEKTMFVLDPSFLKVVYPTGNNPIDNAWFNGKTRFIINQSTKTFSHIEFSLVTYMSMMNSNSNSCAAIKIVA